MQSTEGDLKCYDAHDRDPGTGGITVERFMIAYDVGRAVNPVMVEGQLVGGCLQGLGGALYEEFAYDDRGQPLAVTFADYLLPGATEIPDIKIGHMVTPAAYTKFGMKGMGEGGAIAPPAAIGNALRDAFAARGAEFNETPFTPRRILDALDRAAVGNKATSDASDPTRR